MVLVGEGQGAHALGLIGGQQRQRLLLVDDAEVVAQADHHLGRSLHKPLALDGGCFHAFDLG